MATRPLPISVERFVEEARKHPEGALSVPVRRFVGVGEAPAGDERIPIVMSTSTSDRARDTVSDHGWDTSFYEQNSVLQWAHDPSIPAIGTVENLLKGPLRGMMRFAPRDKYEFGGMIGDLYRLKILKAGSVGFMPKPGKYKLRDDGVDFLEQELTEFSCCNVGMNPEALVGAKSMGVQVDLFLPFAQRRLDKDAAAPFWMDADEAWMVHRSLTPRVHVVPDIDKALAALRDETNASLARLEALVSGLAAKMAPATPEAQRQPTTPDPKAVATAAAQAVHRQMATVFGGRE